MTRWASAPSSAQLRPAFVAPREQARRRAREPRDEGRLSTRRRLLPVSASSTRPRRRARPAPSQSPDPRPARALRRASRRRGARSPGGPSRRRSQARRRAGRPPPARLHRPRRRPRCPAGRPRASASAPSKSSAVARGEHVAVQRRGGQRLARLVQIDDAVEQVRHRRRRLACAAKAGSLCAALRSSETPRVPLLRRRTPAMASWYAAIASGFSPAVGTGGGSASSVRDVAAEAGG